MDIGTVLSIVGSVVSLLALVLILTTFLQKGRLEPTFTRKEVELLKTEIRDAQNQSTFRPSELHSIIESFRKDLDNVKGDLSQLTEEERQKIIEGLKGTLTDTASDELLQELQRKVEKLQQNQKIDSIMERHFDNTISRLKEELFSLSKRSSLNLSLGVATTLVGLVMLGYFVFSTSISFEHTFDFIENFVPRLSLVIFIEIFAYFFLRLYKDTLSEIKYFQNEITNIEAKHLAVQIAISSDSENGITTSITGLLSTERNHVLQKGQTTVEIEKARTEQQLTNSVLEKVSGLFGNSSNK